MFVNKFNDSIAAGVAVENSFGEFRCVLDVTNGNARWKFPVGRAKILQKPGNPGKVESPEECAVRELYEETGLIVNLKDLILMKEEWRGDHYRFLYTTRKYDDSSIRTLGIEGGEKVLEGKWIPKNTIVRIVDFLHDHATILRDFLNQRACA